MKFYNREKELEIIKKADRLKSQKLIKDYKNYEIEYKLLSIKDL